MAKKIKNKVIKRETSVWVTRTVRERGEDIGGDEANALISINEFTTEPARVGISKTLPIQFARFLIGKVDVTISMPCYVEEIEKARETVVEMVDDFLREEVSTFPDLLKEVMDQIKR